MATTDRIAGLNGSVGIKAPCRAATTAAITLSGEQTIDGIAIVAGDRVLVKNQSTSSENGVYIASTGAWSRALDFNGSRDARNGTLVFVTGGSTNGIQIFRVSATDPVTIGTTAVTFTMIASLDASTAAAEAAASAASAAASAAAAATFVPGDYVEVAGDAMTGPLRAAAGSAAAPSVTFSGDTNTGLFSKGADQAGVAAGGAEVGYFDSSGFVGNLTGNTTGAVTATSLNTGQLAGFRNVLINGGMQISQRNGTTGTTTADDAYCLDRWYALTQTSTITVTQQSLSEDGTPYHCRLTQAQASAQRMGLAQIVEAANSYPYRGKAVTLSARIRCSSSQAIRYAILEWTGTADSVTSDVVNNWTSGTYTASNFFLASSLTVTAVGSITPSANTWTTLTALNGTVSSSCNNLIVMIWTEATAAQNVTLDIARVQLEQGSNATPFEWRGITNELAFCQRYYRNDGMTHAHYVPAPNSSFASTYPVTFSVTMRTTPSFSFSYSSTNAVSTYTSALYSNSAGFVHFVVASANTNAFMVFTYAANAEL